ncbi:MAG: DUF4384 domain-containing protein [Sphingobacteriaceae bacterium]|nr:DUF4384 domain-containing protein [Sphingobacteriaceae bacterium]
METEIKMKNIFFTCSLFGCFYFPCFAQQPVLVKNLKGQSFIEGDISPNQAKLQALNEAKAASLKEAGIIEHVNSYQMLFTSQAKNDYSQFFSSDIQSEIQGAVGSYTITGEQIYLNENKRIVSEVIIDAEVIKYNTKPDPAFTCNIEGIKAHYNNGDNLSFVIKVSADCFLNIFNITDNGSSLLFPNNYESANELSKLKPYAFPKAEIEYSLGNEQKKVELNRLLFVFTKTQIPFIKMDKEQICSTEAIFSWLYAIPPDQRRTEYFTLTIQK